MEIKRTRYTAKSFYGLLVFLLLLFNQQLVFSQQLTRQDFAQLRIKPAENQNLYTDIDIKFEVEIPYVNSSQIEVYSPEEKSNIVFKTLKRTDSYKEIGGTKIEIWFSFEKEGDYQLAPLQLKVQGVAREISYSNVKIQKNPKQLSPIMIIQFNDGTQITSQDQAIQEIYRSVYEGKEVKFTVYFKYGVQLVNFNWEIPKDSIFTQTREYDIVQTKYVDAKQDELIPVSDFSWTPLLPGEVKFPLITMAITSKSGYKTELKLPNLLIQVLPKPEEEEIVTEELFEQAFEKEQIVSPEIKRIELSKEQCTRLAELRIKERRSIFGINRNKRVELEKSYGLPSDIKEFSIIYLFLSLFFVLVCIVVFIYFCIKKKNLYKIIFFILILCFTSLAFFCISKTKTRHGICLGCSIYTIPDESCESKTELQSGSYVNVQEESGHWYFVLLGENGGWCSKDDVILIK